MTPKRIAFHISGDDRGSLIALEANRQIPFNIARVYYIFNTKNGVERGFHAHRNLQQVAVAVSGSCTMILDNGNKRVEVELNDPANGVYIGALTWREMKNFSDDCVLLVFADQVYDENDYIRDYQQFLIAKNETGEFKQ